MLKAFTLIISTLCVFTTFAQTNEEKGVSLNGKRHGQWKTYQNGKLIKETSYNETGLRSGLEVEYHPNGKVASKMTYGVILYNDPSIGYVNKPIEMLHGPSTKYNDEGLLMESGTYVENRKQGVWLYYYPNGTLYKKENYNNQGYQRGFQEEYHPNGQLREKRWGSSELEKYDEKGLIYLKSDFYYDSLQPYAVPHFTVSDRYDGRGNIIFHQDTYKGLAIGHFYEKDEKGKIKKQGYNFSASGGRYEEEYYHNGVLMREKYNYYIEGGQIEWYINGKLKHAVLPKSFEFIWDNVGNIVNYRIYDSTKVYEYDAHPIDSTLSTSQLENLYQLYSQTPSRSLNWANIKTFQGPLKSYYTKDIVKFETVIKNGKPDQFFKAYYPNGKLYVLWTLKEGIPHGPYKLMNLNGTVKKSGVYSDGLPSGIWHENTDIGVPEQEFKLDSSQENSEKRAYTKKYYNGRLATYDSHTSKTDTSLIFYSNGIIRRKAIFSKKKNKLITETFYESGNLESRIYHGIDGKMIGKKENFPDIRK